MVLNSVPALVFNEENNVLLFKIMPLLKVVKPETFNVEFNCVIPETVNSLFKDVDPETNKLLCNVALSLTNNVLLKVEPPETVNVFFNNVKPETVNALCAEI